MTTVDLKQLLELKTAREPLQEQLDKIDEQIAKLVGGISGPASASLTGRTRVPVKDPVLAALRTAPERGFSIRELMEKTGLSRAAIDRFLYSKEAKDLPELRKVSEGHFRVVAAEAPGAPASKDHDHAAPRRPATRKLQVA